jgi:Ni/Co efflux regulator RcnB
MAAQRPNPDTSSSIMPVHIRGRIPVLIRHPIRNLSIIYTQCIHHPIITTAADMATTTTTTTTTTMAADGGGHGGWVDPHRGAHFDPGRGHGRYAIGERLAWNYRLTPFDWHTRGLWAPPGGYYWSQVDNDFVLAAVATGVIASVIPDDVPIPPPPTNFPPPGAAYPSPGVRLVNGSGACLDVRGGDIAPGAPLILFHCHGSANQNWAVGNDHIVGEAGGCLDVQGGAVLPGAGVVMNACNGGESQRWNLQNGMVVGMGGMCLGGLQGGGDRTPVVVKRCNGGPLEQWSVQ